MPHQPPHFPQDKLTPEHTRVCAEAARAPGANWKRWGTYLPERQWGTVREDYSADGDPWSYFPHEHARSRAYRWGEDGLLGWCDRECRLAFSLALWNHRDPILKERLYGLGNKEGNHGEDVKELYYYLDATPTHSYARALYRYPQAEFPYAELERVNATRGYGEREYELPETSALAENRYFDCQVEYAKAAEEDTLIRVTVTNRGPERAPLTVLGQLVLRNTWIWGCTSEDCQYVEDMRAAKKSAGAVEICHPTLGEFTFRAAPAPGRRKAPELIFTNNETNNTLLYGPKSANARPHVKDAFHEYIVNGRAEALCPDAHGTKAAAVHALELDPGESVELRFRLTERSAAPRQPWAEIDAVFNTRQAEADAYYASLLPASTPTERVKIFRQACAGLLWSKQFYHYVVDTWLDGDPNPPPPPQSRKHGRNTDWRHLFNRDIISMPDKWEYPWYAAWDSAFHMVVFAHVDPVFAKEQLTLFLREWYMHPNGQLPAYEFQFGDVNPPVHAWACWRVYKIADARGQRDLEFLRSAFMKLVFNFTWWVNRKDPEGLNLFGGGFLGLDNIGIFDRSEDIPHGGRLAQADGTAWMAFYCGVMLSMALELARHDRAYADIASKFFEHFIAISHAINTFGGNGLWHEDDGFYYDQISYGDHDTVPLRIRSIVGLIPLCAVEILEESVIDSLPGFRKRMEWFLRYRPELASSISYCEKDCAETPSRRLLAIPTKERLQRALQYLLDEEEFLSPHGIRSLSRYHREHPYVLSRDGRQWQAAYTPGESDSGLFGGNSNWRGPVWFPINYLFIEALQKYHHYYGDQLKVEFPRGSGQELTLDQVAAALSARLISLFEPDAHGQRPAHGDCPLHGTGDPASADYVLFYEYFHGDTGRGLGASHQTGWTALVAKLILEAANREARAPAQPPPPSAAT